MVLSILCLYVHSNCLFQEKIDHTSKPLNVLLAIPYNDMVIEYLKTYCRKKKLLNILVVFDIHHEKIAEAIKLNGKMFYNLSMQGMPTHIATHCIDRCRR